MGKIEDSRKKRKTIVWSILGLAVAIFGGFQIFKLVCSNEEHQFLDEMLLVPKKVMLDQGAARLCWAYTGIAQIEAEIIRQGMDPVDLSEAYIAYYNSMDRVDAALKDEDVSWNFGGCLADVWESIEEYGIVTEENMPYPKDEECTRLNLELVGKDGLIAQTREADLSGSAEGSKICRENILAAHDRCFAERNETVVFQGDTLTPKQFAERLNIRPKDFIQVTSVTDHKYNDWVVMDYKDHWRKVPAWNVPLDTLMDMIDRSIEKGYTVSWDGDISEWGFRWHFKQGFAKLMGKNERLVSPEQRQRALKFKRTTDDHTMLICGTARDENGNKYYIMKNSWGKQLPNGGMLFMTPAYMRYKTIMLTFKREFLGM